LRATNDEQDVQSINRNRTAIRESGIRVGNLWFLEQRTRNQHTTHHMDEYAQLCPYSEKVFFASSDELIYAWAKDVRESETEKNCADEQRKYMRACLDASKDAAGLVRNKSLTSLWGLFAHLAGKRHEIAKALNQRNVEKLGILREPKSERLETVLNSERYCDQVEMLRKRFNSIFELGDTSKAELGDTSQSCINRKLVINIKYPKALHSSHSHGKCPSEHNGHESGACTDIPISILKIEGDDDEKLNIYHTELTDTEFLAKEINSLQGTLLNLDNKIDEDQLYFDLGVIAPIERQTTLRLVAGNSSVIRAQ
jgi:hypothetical protein